MDDLVDRLLSLPTSELKKRQSRKSKKRGSYNRTKGQQRSKAELAAYLRKTGFRTRRQLEAGRVGDDPTPHDYRKLYGSWGQAKNEIWRDDSVKFDRKFVATALIQFKLWTARAYRLKHKERPDILPSMKVVIKEFGSWSALKEIATLMSMRETVCRYAELKEKLGKRPTIKQCLSAGLVIDEALKCYGSKKALDEFIEGLEKML